MLYRVKVLHTTPEKLQAFIYSLTSKQEAWDRTSKTLFPVFDGDIIVSDYDLDEVRNVSVTKEGMRYLASPFNNNTQLGRQINSTLSGDLAVRTQFRIRDYLQAVATQGLATVEPFEYPVTEIPT
jgi:hypothetical protein